MNTIYILNIVLSLLQGTLTSLGTGAKYVKVASEIQAAVQSIERARNEALTNTELESLRTTPQW